MANLLKGKAVADALTLATTQKVEKLKEKNITPTLAILRVGANESDLSYEKGAMKRCASVGVEVKNVILDENVDQATFDATLTNLNEDPTIHAILMFRPLPKHLDNEKTRKMLNPQKDIDGCTDLSLAGVFTNSALGFAPCTAEAVVEMLKFYNIPLTGKNVCVIGRSLVIGKPVSMLLLNENATVTTVHSKTKDIPSISKQADIVVAAIGKMESLSADYFTSGQSVIDVGINFNETKGKLCGDVNFDEVEQIVENITPVPGGVGAVTTCVLVKHVVEACERTLKA